MDEAAARQWLVDALGVSRETLGRLDRYVDLLLGEARHQNLIARSTFDTVWDRHIRDSAQLLALAPPEARSWLDLGSGPGLPGIVLALIGEMEMTLVESRAKRIGFLERAVRKLGLEERITVEGRRLEAVDSRAFDVITARAFAPLPRLFGLAHRFSHRDTRWLLPKGRNVEKELEEARRSWQGRFETVPSVTDPASFIVVASGVEPGRSA